MRGVALVPRHIRRALSSPGAHSYGIIDSVIGTKTSEILKPPMPRLQDVV